MKIKIIALGKIKEKFLSQGIEEFSKRIMPYTSFEIVEISPVEIKDKNLIEKSLELEAEKILNFIKDDSFVITLEIDGANFSSEKFALKIQEIMNFGHRELIFVIGSSCGLAKTMSDRADLKMSLSKMTCLHQFARLMLVEQIYRSFKILNNETYHK